MGISLNTGNTSVTGSVNAIITTSGIPVLGSGQTLVTIQANGSGALQSKYTVTSGKTLYVTYFSQTSAGAAMVSKLYKDDGTTVIFDQDYTVSGNPPPLANSGVVAVYTSGQSVKWNVQNGQPATLIGVEQ